MEKITLDGEKALEELNAHLEDMKLIEKCCRLTADECDAIKGETGMEFAAVVVDRCNEMVEICQKNIKATETQLDDLRAANDAVNAHSEDTMGI